MAEQIKVWDPAVRVFHWALVLAFTTAYLSGEDWLTVHVYAGYTVLGLVAFRLLWGLIGTRHARFSDFVASPRAALAYARDAVLLRARRYVGHNPAGGLMILLVLVSLLLTVLSGLAVYAADQQAGPLVGALGGAGERWTHTLEEAHEFLANFTLLLVFVHVAGVVFESFAHGENLVRAMFTGRKRLPKAARKPQIST
jgi:cytochrome b